MNTKARIRNIENKLKQNNNIAFSTITKFENWIFEIGKKEPITLQEWEEYKQHELKMGVTEAELKNLEDKIRSQDGFMEINFVEDFPIELKRKYNIKSLDE